MAPSPARLRLAHCSQVERAQGQIALLQRPLEQRPPLQSESEPHAPQWPLEHLPTLQSESEPQPPHLPPEQRPLPLQSESEPHAKQRPPEQRPSEQSESEPHAPQRPLEHLPWPWQSESEPQAPHLPPEHLPKPAQSRSEPHEPTVEASSPLLRASTGRLWAAVATRSATTKRRLLPIRRPTWRHAWIFLVIGGLRGRRGQARDGSFFTGRDARGARPT